MRWCGAISPPPPWRPVSIRAAWDSRRCCPMGNIWRGTAMPISFSTRCPATRTPRRAMRYGRACRFSPAPARLLPAGLPAASCGPPACPNWSRVRRVTMRPWLWRWRAIRRGLMTFAPGSAPAAQACRCSTWPSARATSKRSTRAWPRSGAPAGRRRRSRCKWTLRPRPLAAPDPIKHFVLECRRPERVPVFAHLINQEPLARRAERFQPVQRLGLRTLADRDRDVHRAVLPAEIRRQQDHAGLVGPHPFRQRAGAREPAADEVAAGILGPSLIDRAAMPGAKRAGLTAVDPVAVHLDLEPTVAACRAGPALPIGGGGLSAVAAQRFLGHRVSLKAWCRSKYVSPCLNGPTQGSVWSNLPPVIRSKAAPTNAGCVDATLE